MATPGEALRVGLVGCGRAALDLHLPTLAQIEEAGVVAIADPDRAALGAAGEQYGITERFEDWRRLLEDPSIEAICVAAPSHLHAEIGLAALDAGKHLFVEKPLALTVQDCDKLVDAAAGSGLATMVGFNLRWHPHVRRARELVRSGQLGELGLLSSVFASPSLLREIPAWRSDPGRGGGLLALQAIHHLDLWRFLLDREVERVECAAGTESPQGSPGAVAVSALTTDGVAITGSFCAVTGQENGFAVYGSDAWVSASLYRFDSLELVPREATGGDIGRQARRPAKFVAELLRALPRLRRGGDFQASYRSEWRHFARAIRTGRPTECGFEDAREATRILEAALGSADGGGSSVPVTRTAESASS